MERLEVLSVNISDEKGTVKRAVEGISLGARGISGDAHSGAWHRQLSLLGKESFDRFAAIAGRSLAYGEFAENITTSGIELVGMKPLDLLRGNEIELEITQIGKECHGDSCAIFREVGKCVMPKEGIFARVIKGGELKPGDYLEYHPYIYNVEVITLSDRAYNGEYSDRSGPAIVKFVEKWAESTGVKVKAGLNLIPDSENLLKEQLGKHIPNSSIIFTTGGTGIGPRDITSDVVGKYLEKEIPGIMDHIRMKYGAKNPYALISRSMAGVVGKTLIFTLPGSHKAISEYMAEISPLLLHLKYMLHGIDAH